MRCDKPQHCETNSRDAGFGPSGSWNVPTYFPGSLLPVGVVCSLAEP